MSLEPMLAVTVLQTHPQKRIIWSPLLRTGVALLPGWRAAEGEVRFMTTIRLMGQPSQPLNRYVPSGLQHRRLSRLSRLLLVLGCLATVGSGAILHSRASTPSLEHQVVPARIVTVHTPTMTQIPTPSSVPCGGVLWPC